MSFTAAFKQISDSGMFDAAYYQSQLSCPDDSHLEPILHYLTVGANEGKSPHPLFDIPFYSNRNLNTKNSEIDPFIHYISTGAAAGADPHPLFDSKYYLSQCEDRHIAQTNPLLHYVKTGAERNYSPHPLFDNDFYRDQIAQATGINLLCHFVLQGAAAKLSPHPLFDITFYEKHHPEVVESGINPLRHFLTAPAYKASFPHPLFDCSFYLKSNKDVQSARVNPLLHFVQRGAAEARSPHPLFNINYYRQQVSDEKSGVNPLIKFLRANGRDANPHLLFDTDYFLNQIPELKSQNVNPLIYFLQEPFEGADPHPCFKSDFYLSNDAVSLENGENVLLHYLTRNENYRANPNELFDTEYYGANSGSYRSSQLDPLSHYLSMGAKLGDDPSSLISLSGIAKPQRKAVLQDALEAVREVWDGNEDFKIKNHINGHRRVPKAADSPTTISLIRSHWKNWYSETEPELTIIVHSELERLYLESTLKAIWLYTVGKKYEVLVVDTTSTDKNYTWEKSLTGPHRVLKLDQSWSNLQALNFAAGEAQGEFLFFLQAGELPLENWLQSLIQGFEHDPKVVAVTPRSLSPDGRLLAAGFIKEPTGELRALGYGCDRTKSLFRTNRHVDAGRHILTRKDIFLESGGFDERFQSIYGFADFCSRLQEKGVIAYRSQSSVVMANRNDRLSGLSLLSQAEGFDHFSIATEALEKLISGQRRADSENELPNVAKREMKEKRKNKVIIFSEAPSACGSSESYVVALVQALSDEFEITLSSLKQIQKSSWLRISERLGMQLDASQFKVSAFKSELTRCDILFVVGDIGGDLKWCSNNVSHAVWISGVENRKNFCESSLFGHTSEMLSMNWDQVWFPSAWHQEMFQRDWPFRKIAIAKHSIVPPAITSDQPFGTQTRDSLLICGFEHQYLPEIISAALPLLKEIDGLKVNLVCEFDLNDLEAKPLQKLIRRNYDQLQVFPYPAGFVFDARCRRANVCWSVAGMQSDRTTHSENQWTGLLPVLRSMSHGCVPLIYKTPFNNCLMGELSINSWQSIEELTARTIELFENQQNTSLFEVRRAARTLASQFDFDFFQKRVAALVSQKVPSP